MFLTIYIKYIVYIAFDSFDAPMMVDRQDLSSPGSETLDVGLEYYLQTTCSYLFCKQRQVPTIIFPHLQEGDDHAENEPDVNHLDVSCLGQSVENTNIPQKGKILLMYLRQETW